MDEAHKQTDRLLHALENALTRLYAQASREMQREIKSLLDEIYLDDVTATPAQRLKYAEKNGKSNVINKIVDIITSTNKETEKLINQNATQTYAINFEFACDYIAEQIMGGDK